MLVHTTDTDHVEVCSLKVCPGVERTEAKYNNFFIAEWVPKGPIKLV